MPRGQATPTSSLIFGPREDISLRSQDKNKRLLAKINKGQYKEVYRLLGERGSAIRSIYLCNVLTQARTQDAFKPLYAEISNAFDKSLTTKKSSIHFNATHLEHARKLVHRQVSDELFLYKEDKNDPTGSIERFVNKELMSYKIKRTLARVMAAEIKATYKEKNGSYYEWALENYKGENIHNKLDREFKELHPNMSWTNLRKTESFWEIFCRMILKDPNAGNTENLYSSFIRAARIYNYHKYPS